VAEHALYHLLLVVGVFTVQSLSIQTRMVIVSLHEEDLKHLWQQVLVKPTAIWPGLN
jgi:hypothetical protein